MRLSNGRVSTEFCLCQLFVTCRRNALALSPHKSTRGNGKPPCVLVGTPVAGRIMALPPLKCARLSDRDETSKHTHPVRLSHWPAFYTVSGALTDPVDPLITNVS